ncbi:MAG: membrane-bound lytic murein transglycosylase MltF [Desulfosarcinaceae bacterium]|nr:membrane-bound lytic murein transglycosylase MltF [Desulfosarcinaceae bacterium]
MSKPSTISAAPPDHRSVLPLPCLARHRRVSLLALVLLLYLGSTSCEWMAPYQSLHQIRKSGELVVVTRNNANCYYVYRDEEMGFEYELAKAFADHLGVRLRIKIADQWSDLIPEVLSGKSALIAASMTATAARGKQIRFSDSYMTIRQHLIVHRDNVHINTFEEIGEGAIHVREGTSYQERLQLLQREGHAYRIILAPNVPTEELIRRVALREIAFTVADDNIALLNRRYYPQIVISTAVSGHQGLAWGVHPKARELAAEINRFLRKIQSDGRFKEIYERYYGDVSRFDYVDLRTYHRRITSRLPKFEAIIQAAADEFGFDWRLIAAQIYQESHLRVWARSHAGAYGLMQLTRSTAKSLGVTDIYAPEQNIPAGVRHLKNLYDHYREIDGDDRLWIALAAYNIGMGHIQDARDLTRDRGEDPNSWAALRQTLPLLSQKAFYRNSRYGFCRGEEPVAYVRQIQLYYDILKRLAIQNSDAGPEVLLNPIL